VTGPSDEVDVIGFGVLPGRYYVLGGPRLRVYQPGLVDRSYFEELAKHAIVIAVGENEERFLDLKIPDSRGETGASRIYFNTFRVTSTLSTSPLSGSVAEVYWAVCPSRSRMLNFDVNVRNAGAFASFVVGAVLPPAASNWIDESLSVMMTLNPLSADVAEQSMLVPMFR
jgi:hypothetical protein